MKKLNIVIIALVAMASTVEVATAVDSTYIYYNSRDKDMWNIDQTVWLEQKSPTTFWALYWTWKGSDYGGYMGIQTGSSLTTKYDGETAIFSLWNANGASGMSCKMFDGEGVGYHCYIPMKVVPGTTYKYRVWKLNATPEGQWWGAWINDEYIGSIRVKSENIYIGSIISFSEYYGTDIPCDRTPFSISNWEMPTLNNNESSASYISSEGNKCENTVIKNQNDIIRMEKGDREEETIPPQQTSTPVQVTPTVIVQPTVQVTPTVIVQPTVQVTPLQTPCKKWDGVEWVDCQPSESFSAGQKVMDITGQFIHGMFNQLIRGLNGWTNG